MTADGESDAVSYAFVAIMRSQTDVTAMGMHALGLRDLVMKRTDVEVEGFDITEVMRYVARGEKPIQPGHLIADPAAPRYQVFFEDSSAPQWPDSPMFNPFGQLRLVSIRDIAESN